MDIVLPLSFNNPNLPVVQRPGFRDDFDRPAADVLGTTTDGKLWTVLDSGSSSSVWGTFGDGTAGMKSSSSQYHLALADALTPDGTLTAVVGDIGATSRRWGLTVRAQGEGDYIYIAPIGTNPELRMAKQVGGNTTPTSTIGPVLSTGDTVTVALAGPSIIVSVNGASVISDSIPEFTGVTTHGMYAFSGAEGSWRSIEFTPA